MVERIVNIYYTLNKKGGFSKDSDVDIIILADVQPEQVSQYADRVYDVTYDFKMKYDIEINPSVQSKRVYNHWKNIYPFLMNSGKDGIAV